jgi:hypothetical protein
MEAKPPDRATVEPRVEDDVLLRGQGRYMADARWPNQAYACFVRSPHACARIAGLDVAAAREAPGIVGVLTGSDAAELGSIGRHPPLAGRGGKPLITPRRPDVDIARFLSTGAYKPPALPLTGDWLCWHPPPPRTRQRLPTGSPRAHRTAAPGVAQLRRSMRISYGPFTATKINPGQSTLPGLLQVVASTVGSCDPGGVGVSGDGGMPPGLGRCHCTYISPSEHHVIVITHRRVCGLAGARPMLGAARVPFFVRLSYIDFNADNAGNTSDASDVIDGSASRTHAPA